MGLVMISLVMILLAATVFRPQIPFFRLLDQDPSMAYGVKPSTMPGVTEIGQQGGTQLYMILGSDFRPDAGFRTDVILLVAVNQLSGKVSLVSFPRDLWVVIPGYGEQRINTVMQTGGFGLMADTMQVNFGIYPTEYAMVDMEGFLEVIDVLGGITIQTDAVTADACDSSLDPDGWCEVGPGAVSLDSAWALWYVRARYNSSDFDRMRRTQEVALAIFKKAAGPNGLLHSPDLLNIYSEKVETNISSSAVLPLMKMALNFDGDSNVRQFSIGPNETTAMVTSQGAAILLPNTAAIQAILNEAMDWVDP
jgi:LCP family protein required for cell wall assembly